MKWHGLPFEDWIDYNVDDLKGLSPKAILTLQGHPVRILQNWIFIPKYFGQLSNIELNDHVILLIQRNKQEIEVEIDKTVQVHIARIGL